MCPKTFWCRQEPWRNSLEFQNAGNCHWKRLRRFWQVKSHQPKDIKSIFCLHKISALTALYTLPQKYSWAAHVLKSKLEIFCSINWFILVRIIFLQWRSSWFSPVSQRWELIPAELLLSSFDFSSAKEVSLTLQRASRVCLTLAPFFWEAQGQHLTTTFFSSLSLPLGTARSPLKPLKLHLNSS